MMAKSMQMLSGFSPFVLMDHLQGSFPGSVIALTAVYRDTLLLCSRHPLSLIVFPGFHHKQCANALHVFKEPG